MKEQILSALRADGGYVSGQALSSALGVSRTAVWKAVQVLRAQGYNIHSVSNRGYRLLEPTKALCREEILAALPQNHPWRSGIQYFDTIDSTNTYAKALASAGAPEGTVIIADSQTGGRGRLGRSFHSPAGMGIYLSAILRPNCAPGALMHLTCAVAEAMCDAIDGTVHRRPGIKWTNDLVLDKKKLAGILTELSIEAESGLVQYAVVGIGVNCCQRPEDFPAQIRDTATSLQAQTGSMIDRNRLCAAMIESIQSMRLLPQKAQIMAQYRKDCVTIGQSVSVIRGDSVRHADALEVDDDGALIVRYDSGEIAAVSSGEVSVRGMYGYV